jgi:hypothetical protein
MIRATTPTGERHRRSTDSARVVSHQRTQELCSNPHRTTTRYTQGLLPKWTLSACSTSHLSRHAIAENSAPLPHFGREDLFSKPTFTRVCCRGKYLNLHQHYKLHSESTIHSTSHHTQTCTAPVALATRSHHQTQQITVAIVWCQPQHNSKIDLRLRTVQTEKEMRALHPP